MFIEEYRSDQMTTAQILIEVGKMIFPVLTVGLAAYLAAR